MDIFMYVLVSSAYKNGIQEYSCPHHGDSVGPSCFERGGYIITWKCALAPGGEIKFEIYAARS